MQLRDALGGLYLSSGRVAHAADGAKLANETLRLIRQHPRWDSHGDELWGELVERTSIGHLSRYLDTLELRMRVRAYSALHAYYLIGTEQAAAFAAGHRARGPDATWAKAALDGVERSLPTGKKLGDLAIHLLARIEASFYPAKEELPVLAAKTAWLKDIRDSRIYLSSVGLSRSGRDTQVMSEVDRATLAMVDVVHTSYRHPGWNRTLAGIRGFMAIKRFAAEVRARRPSANPPDNPPFSHHLQATMALKIDQGLGPTFVARLALETSAVVAGIHNLTESIENAFTSYRSKLEADEEARRRQREILVKVLALALTPVIGPLSGLVGELASAALEAGIKAFDAGAAAVTEALTPVVAPLPELMSRSIGKLGSDGRSALKEAGGAGKETLEEETSPVATARRMAERVMPDPEDPGSLKDALTAALNREIEGFLSDLLSSVEAVQEDLAKTLLATASGGPSSSGAGSGAPTPKALELAALALWHVHRTHEESGAKTYPTQDALVLPTFVFLDALFANYRAEIERQFTMTKAAPGAPGGRRINLQRHPDLDRLIEWKIWALHFEEVWKEPSTKELYANMTTMSGTLGSSLEQIRFLVQTSDDRYDEGVIRYGYWKVGSGAKGLAGAFVHYMASDAFNPFSALRDLDQVEVLLTHKVKLVRAIYDAHTHLKASRGGTEPSWEDVHRDAIRRL